MTDIKIINILNLRKVRYLIYPTLKGKVRLPTTLEDRLSIDSQRSVMLVKYIVPYRLYF